MTKAVPAYERLLSPAKIGSLQLGNRVVCTAHGLRLSKESLPADRDVAYYREKARGGPGLIVQEALRVHPTSLPSGSIAAYDPRMVGAARRVVDAVHGEGRPLIGQIAHQGRQTTPGHERLPLWAPSATAGFFNLATPHRMTISEIAEVIEGFRVTATHLVAAGYDGVEVHAAHGYLIQEFLSPLTNRRDDGYGGSAEKRLRFAREVIDVVRSELGGRVLGVRISADEFTEGGYGVDDAVGIVEQLVASADIDYVSVSHCTYEGTSLSTMVPDMFFEPGSFVYLGKAVKAAVPGLPIITVGGINTPELAERILHETEIDLIGMARAQIADPQLVAKLRSRESQVRPCLGVNACWRAVINGQSITCAVNPRVGRETEWVPERELRRRPGAQKHVVVVGGGPAGLEAARALAEMDLRVTLFEAAEVLGGQLRLAARAPGRARLGDFVSWAATELSRLGVTTRLASRATSRAILAESPDAIVVATGSRPHLELPADDPGSVMHIRDVLAKTVTPRGRVVVVDRDWEWQAPSIAEYLSDRACDVTIVTEKLHLGKLMSPSSIPTMLERLDKREIDVITSRRATRFEAGRLFTAHAFSNSHQDLNGIDCVVVAGGAESDDDLLTELSAVNESTWAVGDALAPRYLQDAIFDGQRVAREIRDVVSVF